jgi:hypothetical protein
MLIACEQCSTLVVLLTGSRNEVQTAEAIAGLGRNQMSIIENQNLNITSSSHIVATKHFSKC